jgi:AbrB family looped-hinge helix DNA binding protein
MPVLSPKRQVTLPKQLCDRLGVQPGDDLLLLEHKGRITILKRTKGRSRGLLRGVQRDPRVSERESLESTIEERRIRAGGKRRVA